MPVFQCELMHVFWKSGFALFGACVLIRLNMVFLMHDYANDIWDYF